jgi:sensor histidine kinase YesM
VEEPRFKIETWQMLFVAVASAFAVVILNSLSFGLSAERLLDSLTHTFFIASIVSIGIFYFAPKIYKLSVFKRMLFLVPVIYLTTLIGIILARIFLSFFEFNIFNSANIWPGLRTTVFSLIISYVFGLSAYFYIHSQNKLNRTRELLRQKELDEAKAKSLAVKAQLESLESRIHPHFLFNTLNSIAALIKENPDLAENIVEKLSVLLRYSLDFQAGKLVTLEKELKITRDYLAIESVRFAKKLEYKFDIQEDYKDKKIPAFSLQTLVENSIKHVASKRSALTKINIGAENSDGLLKIEVSDNGDGFSKKDIKAGHGLDTLQKRLENIFDGRANLEILEDNSGGKVKLTLPI